jgi:hypothetical protein
MVKFDEADVYDALLRLEGGLCRYRWIQKSVHCCDVSSNREFQKTFNGFYKVRRNQRWRDSFYALMQAKKRSGIGFPEALASLHLSTGRIEASFASKLVATLDPSTPVIDSVVLSHFELKLPVSKAPDRKARVVSVYQRLCAAYAELLDCPMGVMLTERFDQHFQGTNLTRLKKIDLVLWQIRPIRAKGRNPTVPDA